MTLNLDDLERVAKAATPGVWTSSAVDDVIPVGYVRRTFTDPTGRRVTEYVATCAGTTCPNAANAAHIAAFNRETALYLISRARGAERLEEMLALTQELWGLNNELDDALDDERPALERAIKKASKRLSALNEGGPANG